MISNKVKLGIVGCGDVAFRSYLPGLAKVTDQVRITACCDLKIENAERAAEYCSRWSQEEVRTYTDYMALLRDPDLDAIVNLSPVPFHYEVNAAALEAGVHVYSEKPIASDIGRAQALIESARKRQTLLMCSPAVMATSRFRWLKEVLASGRLGQPTLIMAQLANLGPAAWREYTGDPAVFYGPDVGPLIDQGIYLLHAITGLLGPARWIQAMGGISIPRRKLMHGPTAGRSIELASNDHVLIQLGFGDNTFAQVLSSYAVAASKVPTMEIHCTEGSVSLGGLGDFLNANAAVDVFVRDGSELGMEGWMDGVAPSSEPSVTDELVSCGPIHFVSCLNGNEKSLLTAEHACHTLEIMVKVDQAIREGRSLELETSF